MKTYPYFLAATFTAVMIVTTAKADYPSTVLSYNPSAYWRLNETTPVPPPDMATNTGIVGLSGDGYYLNGAAHPVGGIPGGGTDTAATFSNPSGKSQLRVPFQPGLNQAGPFTAEFWAKPATTGATVCPYSSVDFPNRGWLFYQELSAGQWSFRVYKSGANLTITGGAVTANDWQQVVGVYDGTNVSLYVNGQIVAGPTALGAEYSPVLNANIPLTMAIRSDNNFAYNGDMDEVVLYTNALSDAEILAHYQAGTNPATVDYSAEILPNHPAGYWRLDEPTYIPGTLPVANNLGYLGASAQGTYQPGVTDGVAGPGYSGLGGATVSAFNGVAGYVDCGYGVPDLSAPLSSITIMVWARFSDTRAMNWESIITCGDTAWELQRPDNDYSVSFRFAGTDLTTPSDRPINDGQWHHIAATYDGAQQKIYIDGALAASGNKTGSNSGEGNYPILIGENGVYPGRVFRGNLAEMAVFTNALSASDVSAIYNSSFITPTILTSAYASPSNFVYEGTPVSLNVGAFGAPPLHYQWNKDGAPISGATVSSYPLTPSAVVGDSGTYSVVVTNSSGSVTSSVVLAVVGSRPLIVTQPASITAFVGSLETFTVVDAGSLPRTYQWQHNATPIPGGTTATLTLPNVQWGDAGTYTCTISNVYGSTNTAPATLTISPGGQFVGLALPDALPRDRHTALGSDGSNMYFTHGNTPNGAAFYKIPQNALTGWTSLAPLPTPPTINADIGVGDLGYSGGSLYCWVTEPSGGTSSRVVTRYDIAGDFWVSGGIGANDGPNSGCAPINETNILGGWMGWTPVYQATDWTNGVLNQLVQLPGGAVHPWDSCVGQDAVYFIKHWNVAASNAVLASFTKTATPTVSYIDGMPFNIGSGCAIEYMPGSLFEDGHDRLYIERGMTGTTDDDAGEQYGHWTTPTTTDQLAVYDLVSQTWTVETLPFVIDVGSEMCLVNNTLYILAGNGDPAPLKMLYLGPPVQPTIVNQPASQTVYAGQPASFSVGPFGGGPFTFQWRLNGSNISGATDGTLTLPSAYYTDAGIYDVVVTNPAGNVTSQTATLTVLYGPPLFANLTNDLVLHLTFDTDTNFADTSGHGNDAAPLGATIVTPGRIGDGAVSVNTDTGSGIFNYVYIGFGLANEFFFGPEDSFSVSFWINTTNWQNDLPMIGNAANSTYQPGWVFAQDQNKIELSLATSSSNPYVADPVAGSPIITDGQWHNIVGVIDRTAETASVYVDGALAGSFSIVGLDSLDDGQPVVLGQGPTGSYGVDGAALFDDVGIWRRALSPTEAEAVYLVSQQGTSFDTYGPVMLTMRRAGTEAEISWQTGTLLSSSTGVVGTYTPVAGASPPYYRFTPGPTTTFYKVQY